MAQHNWITTNRRRSAMPWLKLGALTKSCDWTPKSKTPNNRTEVPKSAVDQLEYNDARRQSTWVNPSVSDCRLSTLRIHNYDPWLIMKLDHREHNFRMPVTQNGMKAKLMLAIHCEDRQTKPTKRNEPHRTHARDGTDCMCTNTPQKY